MPAQITAKAIQITLREMLIIGIAIGIIFLAVGRNVGDAAGVTSCLLAGLLFSPVGWAIYRLGKFIVIPRREAASDARK